MILAVDALGERTGTAPGSGHHARHARWRRTSRELGARVRLPVSRRASPASPAVRRSTRIEPERLDLLEAPPSSARRKTWYGGRPPSAGSGKTSWMTSSPPGISQCAQPV